jgi:hypothetical protein
MFPRTVALVFMATLLAFSGWAASEPTCERYAVHELLPGMSHDKVLSQMGGEGVKALILIPGSGETSGVDYSNPTSRVYVEYDRRVDRRRTARAVRVRASMPLSPTTAQTLVSRLGPPDAGANDLADGLLTGAALWVDEACGVVSTAYRAPASWWTEGGGTFLQVETLDLARQASSPASPRLGEILARKHGPAAVAVAAPETLPVPPPLLVRITTTAKDVPPSPPPVHKP